MRRARGDADPGRLFPSTAAQSLGRPVRGRSVPAPTDLGVRFVRFCNFFTDIGLPHNAPVLLSSAVDLGDCGVEKVPSPPPWLRGSAEEECYRWSTQIRELIRFMEIDSPRAHRTSVGLKHP